jgi:hypothetical protein
MRPVVSPIDSPSYVLAGLLQKILIPLAGHTDSLVRNSERFVHALDGIKVQGVVVS